uniref:Uncharacterized protein n=1 Tax=Tanacetum cinerariifolium TaxID=118510 RepID=A0A699H0T2_TANCI|nr:hypothetical protein [Tanacetum cinerariifolium]
MSLANLKATIEYQEAIQATEDIEPPTVGFAKTKEKLIELEEKFDRLKQKVHTIIEDEIQPADLEDSISSLAKRLDNFSISGLQHIHLGIFIIRLHALHQRSAGTNALVVLRDTRWEDSRQIIATMEIDLFAGMQLFYTFPDMILSVNDFHNHVEVAIQTHGYDTWQGATGWGDEFSDDEITLGKVTILNESEERSFLDEYLPQWDDQLATQKQISELEWENPYTAKREQIIKKHEEHAFPTATNDAESSTSYQPPPDVIIGPTVYPPARQNPQQAYKPDYQFGYPQRKGNTFYEGYGEYHNSQWTLPPAWIESGVMLVLPADPGLWSNRKRKVNVAAWRTAYPGAYSALETIADDPQNITSQLAIKSGKLYFPSTTEKLFAKLPPSLSKKIEESFKARHPGLSAGALPAIKFTHTFVSEMCNDAALTKELRDLSFCSAIPIPRSIRMIEEESRSVNALFMERNDTLQKITEVSKEILQDQLFIMNWILMTTRILSQQILMIAVFIAYQKEKETTEYQEAIQATEDIEPPAVHFTKTTDYKGGLTNQLNIVIKQNNTKVHTIIEKEIQPVDIEDAISSLAKRLDNFSISEIEATGWGDEFSDDEITPGKVTILNELEERSDWNDDERSGGKILVIKEKLAQNQQDFLDEYLPQWDDQLATQKQRSELEWENPFATKRDAIMGPAVYPPARQNLQQSYKPDYQFGYPQGKGKTFYEGYGMYHNSHWTLPPAWTESRVMLVLPVDPGLWSDDFWQLAIKLGKLYFPSTTEKLFAKLPPSLSKKIEESFKARHLGLNAGVLPAIKFTYTFVLEMCKDAALAKELKDLSLSFMAIEKINESDDEQNIEEDYDSHHAFMFHPGAPTKIAYMVQSAGSWKPDKELPTQSKSYMSRLNCPKCQLTTCALCAKNYLGKTVNVKRKQQHKPEEEKDFSSNEVRLLKELLKEKTKQVQQMIKDQAKEYYEGKIAIKENEELWQTERILLVRDLTDALKIINQLKVEQMRLEEKKDEEIEKLKAQLQEKRDKEV